MKKQFQKVERAVHVKNSNSWENDAEHRYKLAMFAWYIIEKDNLDLDMIRENKNPRIKISPEIDKYWQELLKKLEENEKELFFIDS